MASKRKVRRRVAKALRKYVRGNPEGGRGRVVKRERHNYWIEMSTGATYGSFRTSQEARKWAKGQRISVSGRTRSKPYDLPGHAGYTGPKTYNPPRVKGRKTKGGRAVTLRNFTGTIVKKSDGTVQIVGRGRKQ